MELEELILTVERQVPEFRMLRVTSGSANGQQRWRLDASAKVLIQLLLYVLYAGRCTAQQQNGKRISGEIHVALH